MNTPSCLKRSLDGSGDDLGSFLLVGLRGGIENYEERKQKSDEVGVGNQPALVIGMGLVSFLPAHALAPAAFSAGACCLCSGK